MYINFHVCVRQRNLTITNLSSHIGLLLDRSINRAVAIVLFERASYGSFSRFIIRTTQRFGILTYAIYVCHEPIYAAFHKQIPEKLGEPQSILWTTLAIVITFGVGTALYALIEKPFDIIKRHAVAGAS